MTVEQADATRLRAPATGAAALLSVFGLQLLPDPAVTLGSWLKLLSPKGLAVIAYWPHDAEESGPFQCLRRLLRSADVLDGTWQTEVRQHIRDTRGPPPRGFCRSPSKSITKAQSPCGTP